MGNQQTRYTGTMAHVVQKARNFTVGLVDVGLGEGSKPDGSLC